MGFLGTLKNALYKMDFFYTAELLRYREEPEYRTIFGGVLSFSIIILLLVTFYNKVIDTFEKIIISSSFSALSADDPTSYNISTMPGEPFMFGVQIWHHNLNANPRYFDVHLTNAFYDTGEYNDQKSEVIPLEPCTKEHWSEYPHIQESYERLSINYWLCLPKNREYEIFGKYASVTSKTLEVSVSKCTNSSDFEYPCASEADIAQFFQDQQTFFYTIYFINPLLNPDSQQYLSYYLEDSNYVIFSARGGEECQLWMEDFTITTDESILPFAEEKVETGGIVTKNCIKNHYEIDPTASEALYSTMTFFKSPISKSIGRNFQKIDEILSYIGGLFGTIAICLFLVNVYNGYSFEVLMGGYLFKPDDDNMKKDLKKYNFFYFLGQLFYAFLSLFGSCCSWKTAKLYYECREEMTKQLDILYLYKRVVLLERGLGTLLSEQQISALHLMEKPTLHEAKKIRRKYKFNHDGFLYRLLKEKSELFEFNENVSQKKIGESLEQVSEIPSEPHNITNDLINGHIAGKNIIFPFHESSQSRLKKPDFLDEHEQSSDSEEDGEEKNQTSLMLRQLTYLRADARQSSISRNIWNSLSQNVQSVVDTALVVLQCKGDSKDDHNLILEEPNDPTHLQGKPKIKRFKQLPALMIPEEVKVGKRWSEQEQIDYQGFKKQESLNQFVELPEFQSPVKKSK